MFIYLSKEFKIKMNHLDEKLFSSLNQKNLKNMVNICKFFILRVIAWFWIKILRFVKWKIRKYK